MFDTFNKKTAQNCVDTMRTKEISELLNSGLDMEYQKNITLDLTSRFTAYKALLKEPTFMRTLSGSKLDRDSSQDNPLKTLLLKVQDDRFFCLVSKTIVRHLLSKLHVFLQVFDDVKEVHFVNDLETQSLTTPNSDKQGHPLSEEGMSGHQSPRSERVIADSDAPFPPSESTLYLGDKRAQKVSSAVGVGPPRVIFGGGTEKATESAIAIGDHESAKTEDANCLTPPKKHLTNASTSARFNLEKDSNSKKHEQRFRTEVQEAKLEDQSKGPQMNLGSPRPFCATTSKKIILKNIEEVLEIQLEDRYGLRSSIGNFERQAGDPNRILDLEAAEEGSSRTGPRDSVKSRSSALRSDDNLREFENFSRGKKLPKNPKKSVGKEYCNPCTLI